MGNFEIAKLYGELRNSLRSRFLFLTGLVAAASIILVSVISLAQIQQAYVQQQLGHAYDSIKSIEFARNAEISVNDPDGGSVSENYSKRKMELYGIRFARLNSGGKSSTFLDWMPSHSENVRDCIVNDQLGMLELVDHALLALFSASEKEFEVVQVVSEWSQELLGPPPRNSDDLLNQENACAPFQRVSGTFSNFAESIARVENRFESGGSTGARVNQGDSSDAASVEQAESSGHDAITIQYLLANNREYLLGVAVSKLQLTVPFLLLMAAIVFIVAQKWIVSPVMEFASNIEGMLGRKSNRSRAKSTVGDDPFELVTRTEIHEFRTLADALENAFRANWIIKTKRKIIIHDEFIGLCQKIKLNANDLTWLIKDSARHRGGSTGDSIENNSKKTIEIAEGTRASIDQCVDLILTQLTNVLDFVNLQSEELELTTFSLHGALNEEIEACKDIARGLGPGQSKSVDIEISLESDLNGTGLDKVRADRNAIKNAVGNLIRNAVMAIYKRRFGSKIVVMASMPADGEYNCVVIDDGPGIAGMKRNFGKSVIDIDFPRHPSSDRTKESLSRSIGGIGLYSAAQSARRHGGDLTLIETFENEGTKFCLAFKSQDEKAQMDADAGESS